MAQYGNEWIAFNQPYFKIPVARDGMYRLTYEALQTAGFPVNSADYQRIQIFHRGTEQRIHIVKANPGVNPLQPGDYIEFYGIKNTGNSDSALYKPNTSQPNRYYNLYSDTTAYFLTVNALAQPGKRMELFSEINVTNIPVEVFHTDQKLRVLATQYATGIQYNFGYVQNSFFDIGEGWTGDMLSQNQSADYLFDNILVPATAQGNPQLEVQVVGRADVEHNVELSVGPNTPSRVVTTQNFSGFTVHTFTVQLNWSDIGGDGKMTVRIRALGVGGGADRLSASFIRLTYPQQMSMASGNEKIFQLNSNPSDKSYIEIQNAPSGVRLFDVSDPANVTIIGTTTTTTLNAVVPNTATSRKILATKDFGSPPIRSVSFRPFDPAFAEFVIVSHTDLMKPAGSYSNAVKAYAGYRASTAGGGYDTLSIDIRQLYNQFNYGEISPLAIRRFMKYLVENGSPRYLFLIGKGLDVSQGYHRNPSAFPVYKDLVPTPGMPASDMVYTAGLASAIHQPAVPTGRITAKTAQEVAAYLDKVKEMEALPFNSLWRKELLHLSGGINPGEPEFFQEILEEYEEVAESFYLGGAVTPIAKNNTEIEFINISDKVNSGINLVTLFGHSSPSQNDFNIGYVSAPELGYNNSGRYPMFLINGCNAGEFFGTTTRYGEDWILAANKGALGFMANTSFGFASLLRVYSSTFYNVAYGDSAYVHRGIGDIQKEVVRRFTSINSTAPWVAQAQQMFLLGDPAVKLFGASKPDYEINNNSVYAEAFTPESITALSDSFAINLIVRNFGRAKEDSISVQVTRTFNDNTTVTYDSIFPPVLFQDTLSFIIYRDERGFGNNRFTLILDPDDVISELDKSNNLAELEMFIPLNSARNLFPHNFAIVNSTAIDLTVQSTDILGQARDFVIQLDTLNTFDSPFAQEFVVNGIIARQTVNLILGIDTLAYYWRSRLAEPEENESDEWATASFTFIDGGQEGWAQVHFPQYLSNAVEGLLLDESARAFHLKETVTDFSIYTFGANHPSPPSAVSVKFNQTEYNPVSFPELQCRDNTINIIAFNKTTAAPYITIPVQYPDKRACGRRPEVIASFLSTEVDNGSGKDLVQFIANIPAGDSVILFSIGNPGYSGWSASVLTKLAEIGVSAAQVSALQAGEPVVIFAKKGSVAGSAIVTKSTGIPADQQELQVEATITGRYVSGTMTSTIVGPATAWFNLFTQVRITELPQTDTYTVDVVGKTLTGSEQLLKIGIHDLMTDLSDIDATQYPYLYLIFHGTDEINLTPPQLRHWMVTYTPAAEGVLLYPGPTDTQMLQEGEPWTGTFGFENISQQLFSDSLTVHYGSTNSSLRVSQSVIKKIKAPLPGEQVNFDVTIDTEGMAGQNSLRVFVNPRIVPELYYDNNVLELQNFLEVNADVYDPVLDVTVDGRHLVNGDYVSSHPEIMIRLWDENPFLLKSDTTGMNIFLKYPCAQEECSFVPIYFSRTDVLWNPATTTQDFQILFTPAALPEGMYALRVEARDVRNNSSGAIPYEIEFIVATDNSIIVQRPYPNPSPSNFFFNVVVTGDNLPDRLDLQLVRSDGRTVAAFVKNDFFTGTNPVVWESKDANGNNLPSGLYVYTLVVSRNGKIIQSQTGKIALVR